MNGDNNLGNHSIPIEKPLVEVRDVCFSYEVDVPVLAGASISVGQGECVCLMGMNGCGKSTLIDCVLGEHIPQSGEILLGDTSASKLSAAYRARIAAYVPQVHDRTFPYEVEHVVLMGRAAYAGMFGAPTSDEDREAVAAALNICGINHLAKRAYTTLSGGEMQMVMLARALAQNTPLVIMDEPTAHLDFRNELLFLEAVESLVLERGKSVLMATHSPNQAFHLEATGMRTRVALMDGGKVAIVGAPAEVLTEESLARVFKVDGCLTTFAPEPGSTLEETFQGRPVHQILPVRTR